MVLSLMAFFLNECWICNVFVSVFSFTENVSICISADVATVHQTTSATQRCLPGMKKCTFHSLKLKSLLKHQGNFTYVGFKELTPR